MNESTSVRLFSMFVSVTRQVRLQAYVINL